jgi:NitT/TauT family transport system substrate-binding protein
MIKWFAMIISLMLSAGLFAAEQALLRVGLNPWIGNSLFYIAQEKGFFDKENIKVELIKYNEGSIAKQLLGSGKIDMIPTTPETPVLLENAGISVKVVGILNNSLGADGIIANESIKNIGDLKGKKVAFEEASSSHLLLAHFLKEQGLTLNDITPVNLSATDSVTAFIAGKVDAAVTWDPWLSMASERKGGHVLVDSKAMALFPDFYIFPTQFIAQKPDVIKAMLRALFTTTDFVKKNPDEAIAIISKNYQITPAMTKTQLGLLKWLNYKENLYYFKASTPNNANTVLQEAADIFFKSGVIQKPIRAESLIDNSLLITLYPKS